MFEWTDPKTGEEHRCPARFMAVFQHLKTGRSNARLATYLLRLMGEKSGQAEQRHLRKAVYLLQMTGWLVVSERSSKGGYFIPANDAEVEQYCKLQESLARSMMRTVETLRESWYR